MTKVDVRLLILVSVLKIATAGYSDCGSTVGSVVSVEITGCNDSEEKCTLHRGTNATVKITFNLKEDTDTIRAVVHGVVMDVPIPFALPNSDGCVDSGLSCPIKGGQTYTYVATLPVLRKYPRVTVDVKWELQNKEKKDIVCILIPSKIQ